MSRVTRRLAAAALVALSLVACSSDSDGPRPAASETLPLPTLPPGELRSRVLQPSDVPRTLVPIDAQTGTRDLAAIAAFSADPASATKSLQQHGFQSAYVVQYGDPDKSGVVTNVVTKFATAEGATADLTADIAASARTGTPFDVPGLGDQAGGVRGKLEPTLGEGTLITLRWRVGDTTWLLAVGARNAVDEASVRRLAEKLIGR